MIIWNKLPQTAIEKTVSKREAQCARERHMEGFSDALAAEESFPTKGTEVQRTEQIAANGN
ncbi:MAG: hypothetical protein NC305_04120 [Lachnospiraceae bacterium]|nr:hypothetical protein [Lachnospiraceae bacterium]